MSLPILKQEHIRQEVTRIGNEIRRVATEHLTKTDVNKLNALHNYIITFWLKLHGPENISVFRAFHKMNNFSER